MYFKMKNILKTTATHFLTLLTIRILPSLNIELIIG